MHAGGHRRGVAPLFDDPAEKKVICCQGVCQHVTPYPNFGIDQTNEQRQRTRWRMNQFQGLRLKSLRRLLMLDIVLRFDHSNEGPIYENVAERHEEWYVKQEYTMKPGSNEEPFKPEYKGEYLSALRASDLFDRYEDPIAEGANIVFSDDDDRQLVTDISERTAQDYLTSLRSVHR